jgi:hypothetical protein
MAKLFAMENDDATDMNVAEMDSSAESGEASDVMNEMAEDTGETDEIGENIDTGVDAGESLGDVEELLEGAVESGEGLSPVAAEAVRIAIESICARLDADPKRVYSLYATENFQSGSSRLANTKLALEGVSEFLKDLYKKIKAALIKLWKKVTDFWDKHLSSLGRVKKAIESMKKQVKSSGNKMKTNSQLETMPSSLASAFSANAQLTVASVITVIDIHEGFNTVGTTFLAGQKAPATVTSQSVIDAALSVSATVSEKKPLDVKAEGLVGGGKIDTFADITVDGEAMTVEFLIERENANAETDTSKGMIVPPKDKLTGVLDKVGKLIDGSIKLRKGYASAQTESSKLLDKFNTAMQTEADAAVQKNVSKALNALYKVSTFNTKVGALVATENIRCAKAVLTYVSVCLKQYKA